ncbi:small T antigen [Otomops polyomavirus KY156]|uniref:Small T antigen n=1 Tax=Otomops polyomavirus KY156 TaxID=2035998 RepID=L0GC32_9POLY|nr:small T antigen [Otomops polyomavirus KY156]AGA82581.1 small T antigen [Otomops polyomavirus KY156]
MDRLFEKSEKDKLLQMLGVGSNCFCNFPLMKQAYKKASKKFHPDKGGNNEQMMLLNSLWQKYQEGIIDMRNSEVCDISIGELLTITLQEHFGSKLREMMLKTPLCIVKGYTSCKCICSLLINQHSQLKEILDKKCLTWGECFCYFCFQLWYGLPHNWDTFELWSAVLAEYPTGLLQLDLSKYGFKIILLF